MRDGECKWVSLTCRARATDQAPEVAKYSLNQTILTRIRSRRAGRGAVRAYIMPDFIADRKIAETIDCAAHPWDEEEYNGISNLGMKLYRGLVLSKNTYPGKEDKHRTRPVDPAHDVETPATKPGPLTAESQFAVDPEIGNSEESASCLDLEDGTLPPKIKEQAAF